MRKVVVTLMAFLAVLSARAQTEVADSSGMVSGPGSVPSFMVPAGEGEISPTAADSYLHSVMEYDRMMMPYRRLWNPARAIEVPYSGPSLFSWPGGMVTASSSTVSMPGMMAVESGGLNFVGNYGPVTLSAGVTAAKYGYFRGLQTSYGFNARIDYRINDRWSLTLFGSYYTNVHPLTPAMAGYMNVPLFGGYASYNFSDHWGISVGAQANRSLVTNRWEAQPIVMPYYRFNKDVSIGVDVGGILYNLLKDYVDDNNGRAYGPPPSPSGPPRPTPARVGPRR